MGVDKLITNKGKATATLPSCLSAGDYLRSELIALSYPVVQLYKECAQLIKAHEWRKH